MAQRTPEAQSPFSIAITGAVNATALWDVFCARNSSWCAQAGAPNPIYCLPESAIAHLKKSRPGANAVIDADSAIAEGDLLSICEKTHSVGFWHDQPIMYSHSAPVNTGWR
jgi:hypothetical protein